MFYLGNATCAHVIYEKATFRDYNQQLFKPNFIVFNAKLGGNLSHLGSLPLPFVVVVLPNEFKFNQELIHKFGLVLNILSPWQIHVVVLIIY